MIEATATRFSEFLELPDADLDALQLKLTYVGEQRKLLPTLVIAGPRVLHAEPEILAVQAPGLDFGNDRIARSVLPASPAELRAVLDGLDRFPNVRSAGGDVEFAGVTRDALLVLALYHADGGEPRSLVVPLDPVDAELVLDAMGQALAENKDCRDHLFILWRALGFHIGSLDPDSDGDGASDGRERSRGTDPLQPSSAGDGVLDGVRILAGVDPLNPFTAAPTPALASIDSGPFRGTRVVEVATSPEKTWGTVTIDISYTPEDFVAESDRVVFMQTFKRLGVKANGVRVPIAPSLYLVYAGSPELDQLTIDGETVDHKVGELDPYYNGDDPHDIFSIVPDRQRPGSSVNGKRAARMLYRGRTFEHHWRLLNPEGIGEVEFEYETAVFCANGPAAGQFLGVVEWKWGKKRGEPLSASISSASTVRGEPDATVRVTGRDGTETVPVYSRREQGQPSTDYFKVLSLWTRHHKFPLPGPEVRVDPGVALTLAQPVSISTDVRVALPGELPAGALVERGFRLSGFARAITARTAEGAELPAGCFPFATPLTVTFTYDAADVDGLDERQLGIARLDERGAFTSDGVNILRKSPGDRTITFTTDRFGVFAVVGK